MKPSKSPEEHKRDARIKLWSVRTVRLVVVLGCTGVAGYKSYELYCRWLSGKLSETVEITAIQNSTYPAITFCPQYAVAYKRSVLGALGISGGDYRGGNFFGNSSASDGEEIFRGLTYEVAEVVDSMTLYTLSPDVHTVDIPPDAREIKSRGLGAWREILHSTYGRCHSLELSENVTRLGIHVATMETWLDTYVFLHYPGQFLSREAFAQRGFTKLGRRHYVNVDFVVSVDTMGQASNIPCLSSIVGKYDDCLYRKIYQNMTADFNCVVPWLPRMRNRTANFVCRGLAKYSEEMTRYYNLLLDKFMVCQPPCSWMDVKLGWPDRSDYTRRDASYLRMYFTTRVKAKNTAEDYPISSLVSDIGGYVGLMLGVAVVDIVSVLRRMHSN